MPSRHARILIIDDDEDFRRCLQYALEAGGCEVYSAVDGLDALEKVHTVNPDVITLDLMMPRMNGVEFLEKLNGMPEFSKVPVIVASCAGQPGSFFGGVEESERQLKVQSEDTLRKRGIKYPHIVEKPKRVNFTIEEKSISAIVKRVKAALYEIGLAQ